MGANIVNISKILEKELKIPNYQRPYTWSIKSALELFNDIFKEYENKKVLVGYNGVDGKEVTMSKFKEDINQIRDSRSIYGREVEK